jgi:hypothetical protein
MMARVPETSPVIDPRGEAHARVDGRFDTLVLEPSPPAHSEPPWFADDPVTGAGYEELPDLPVVAPVPRPDVATTWDELARSDRELAGWCADRWLGAWRPLVLPSDLDALAATRQSWHVLAEHVVAPARYQANGKIGLRFTRGGYGTPFFGTDEQVRVAPEGIVVVRDASVAVHPISTPRAAAAGIGVEPGAPTEIYTPTTALDLDASLPVDDAAARFLGDWFGFGASVLEELRGSRPPAETPARVQLWPEHFDLSFDFGDEAAGQRGTYGASPGDDAHPVPYVYVTPWTAQSGEFWNEGSYASLSLTAFAAAGDQRRAALDFFARATAALTAGAGGG